MELRKTPRSLPNRRPYFDKDDVRRIVSFGREWFLDLASRFAPFGSEEPPQHVTHYCFFPYQKNAESPAQNPSLMLLMRTIKNIDLDRAKRYLKYLGFDDVFVRNFLEAQTTCIPTIADGTTSLWSDETFFSLWFSRLFGLTGEQLKEILTPFGTEKWDRRLVRCKAKWESLRITRGAAAAVTDALFRESFPSRKISLSSWIKKLQRWEAETRSRTRMSKNRQGRKRNGPQKS